MQNSLWSLLREKLIFLEPFNVVLRRRRKKPAKSPRPSRTTNRKDVSKKNKNKPLVLQKWLEFHLTLKRTFINGCVSFKKDRFNWVAAEFHLEWNGDGLYVAHWKNICSECRRLSFYSSTPQGRTEKSSHLKHWAPLDGDDQRTPASSSSTTLKIISGVKSPSVWQDKNL